MTQRIRVADDVASNGLRPTQKEDIDLKFADCSMINARDRINKE